MTQAPIRMLDAFRAFQDLPHQIAAAELLDDSLTTEQRQAFQELFRADPPVKPEASPSPGVDWLTPCLAIVKEFEGCKLEAYPDPGTGGEPWTIGWGSTGPGIGPGTVWTQEQADEALLKDVREFHHGVLTVLPMAVEWSGNRQAALTSFAYNIGIGALQESTLRKRLISGDDPVQVVREELPRWIDKGMPSEPGLRRRRAAEVALFCGDQEPQPEQPRPATTNPLAVPYFPQLDNGPEGWRQCQTSSIAMCLAFLKVKGINDDVDYLKVVQRYGDTTSQQAHALALKALGVRARFRQNMTQGDLLGELKAGLPVAIGILHHGPASAPKGGGHYITAIGYTDTAWIVNDPYGELNLVAGGWAKQGGTAGKGQRYSFKNMNPRWLVEGPSTGWGWVFS